MTDVDEQDLLDRETDAARFAQADAAFEACHREDPEHAAADPALPAAVAYHRALLAWVDRLDPTAPQVVRLAALGQHVERWTIPRADYPLGRTGYKQWRSMLGRMHARRAAEILARVGYPEATGARVGELITKKRLKSDPQAQLLEDAVCLVFLEQQLEAFAHGRDRAQVVSILQKTWPKMSERGHAAAHARLTSWPAASQALVREALEP